MIAAAREEQATYLRDKSREELILEHIPQVKLIARRIHKGLPASVSLDDLISSGIVGLIAAIDHYDVRHDVKLRTYAEYKIRGAILDGLRVLDWAPRQKRKRARLIEGAVFSLEQQYQRPPSEEEVANHLGLAVSEYQDWVSETRGLTLGSLEMASSEEDSRDLLRFVAGSDEEWPSALFERSELERLLKEGIRQISRVERTVITLYFYEELTLREIAKKIGLHESRISQLKSQAVCNLRSYLHSWSPVVDQQLSLNQATS